MRPTSDRVREALFSILGQDLTECSVLDAYAGSGILSFEALSRGASHAVLFDRDATAIRQCRETATELGLLEVVTLNRGRVPGCLPAEGAFDLIFVDPPYGKDVTEVLNALALLLVGVLVLEHEGEPPDPSGLTRVDSRQYGRTRLSLFRVKGADPS